MFNFFKKKPIKQAPGSTARKRSGSDRRRAMRRRQREGEGYLWCDGLLSPRPCSVENFSSTGARIAITGSEIPPHLHGKVMRLFVKAKNMRSTAELHGRMA